MSMFACLFLCFISMLTSLDIGFAMLCALCRLVLMWSHLCLDVTTCEIHLRGAGVLDLHLSPLRAMLICLSCFLFTTRLAFFASSHFCTLAHLFMHESVCRPYSNPMELWTLNPNLHLSPQDTPFCLIICLFSRSYA